MYEFSRKKQIFCYFSSMVIWEATWLVQGDIPPTEMLLICQISFIFILSLLIEGDDTLTEFSPFEGKWVEQKSIQKRGETYTNAYVPI